MGVRTSVIFESYTGATQNYPLVSISDSQRSPLPRLNWVKTIHHGYPQSQYTFSPVPKAATWRFLAASRRKKELIARLKSPGEQASHLALRLISMPE
jgi:hypothetical protein